MLLSLRYFSLSIATLILLFAGNFLPNLSYQFLPSAQAQRRVITPDSLIDELLERGVELTNTRQLGAALDIFQRALAASRENGDRERQETALANMGFVYLNLGNSEGALASYHQAFAIFQNPDVLGKIAELYILSGQRIPAIQTYQRALASYRQKGNTQQETNTLIDIGNTYLQLGITSQALGSYQEALEIYRRQQNCRGEDEMRLKMVTIYQRMGQNDLAGQLYQQVMQQRNAKNRQCVVQR